MFSTIDIEVTRLETILRNRAISGWPIVEFTESGSIREGLSFSTLRWDITWKDYYRQHRDEQIEAAAKWRRANRERANATSQRSYYKNHERRLAQVKASREKHKDRVQAYEQLQSTKDRRNFLRRQRRKKANEDRERLRKALEQDSVSVYTV